MESKFFSFLKLNINSVTSLFLLLLIYLIWVSNFDCFAIVDVALINFYPIQALVHVSSAYVNAALKEADEKVYPAPAEVEKILKIVKDLGDKELDAATPGILGDHANTYTFTKHLAEHEVLNGSLRAAAIVRPSMS